MTGLYVERVDDNARLRDLGIDALDSTFGQYAGALWEEPTITGDISRWIERESEAAKLEPTFPDALTGEPAPSPFYDPSGRLSDTDANEQFGIPGHLNFSGPVPRVTAEQLYDQKRRELRRQDIYSRYQGGFMSSVAGFGVGLISQALDPINAASAFVPVVGEARFALWAERFGTAAARTGRGAIEGLAGNLALEPFSYALARDEQRDYTMTDALLNVTFGTIIGAGLHVGGGAVADLFTRDRARPASGAAAGMAAADDGIAPAVPGVVDPADVPAAVRQAARSRPETNEAALRGSVAALIDDRPVRAASVYEAAANPRTRIGDPDVARLGDTVREGGRNWELVEVFGRNGPVLVRDADAATAGAEALRAFNSPQDFTRRTGVRLARDDLQAAARQLREEPESLSQYIRRTGGIDLQDARDYGLLAPGESPVGRLAGLVRRDGRSLDAIREDVSQEAIGYLKDGADLNELAEAVSRDLRAGSAADRVYSLNDFENVQNRIAYEQRFDEASRLAELTSDEIEGIRADALEAARMADERIDPVADAFNDLAGPEGDPFDLETSAVLAADTRQTVGSADRLRDARAALAAAEGDLALLRASGDLSEADIRAGLVEAESFADNGERLMRAYEAGGNCLARAVV